MIKQIFLPIVVTTGEITISDQLLVTQAMAAERVKKAEAGLREAFSTGFTLQSSHLYEDGRGKSIHYLLYRPDGKSIPASELVVTAIASIERGQTRNSLSPMWRCQLLNGEKLNIFQHDDPERDSFHIVAAANWGKVFTDMNLDEQYTYHDDLIPVCVRKDGQWWTLLQIQDKQEHSPDSATGMNEELPFAYPNEDAGAEDEA